MRTSYKNIAVGEIDNLPGSTQVAVFHSAFVLPQFRNSGIGGEAHKARLEQAKNLLYDYALCSVDQTNKYQIKNLENNGWHKLDKFVSTKTGHDVIIYGKRL